MTLSVRIWVLRLLMLDFGSSDLSMLEAMLEAHCMTSNVRSFEFSTFSVRTNSLSLWNVRSFSSVLAMLELTVYHFEMFEVVHFI